MRGENLETIFNQVKEQTLQEMKNFYLNQAFRLAAAYVDCVLLDQSYERKDLRAILETFTYADFTKMHHDWLKTGSMSWIVHGNFTEAEAIEVVETARSILNLKPV
jgi:secreted Zn-dependent insulinase-like peptidase